LIQINIEEELTGKNPKRVAPQVRRQVTLQSRRVVSYLTVAGLCAGGVTAGHLFEGFPTWVLGAIYFGLAGSLFSAWADWGIYKHQKEKLRLIEELLAEH